MPRPCQTMVNVEIGGKKVEGIVAGQQGRLRLLRERPNGPAGLPDRRKACAAKREAVGHVPDAADSGDAPVRPAECRPRRIEGTQRSARKHRRRRPRFKRRRCHQEPATTAAMSSGHPQNMVKRRSTKRGPRRAHTSITSPTIPKPATTTCARTSSRWSSRSSRKRRTRPEGKRTARAGPDCRRWAFEAPGKGLYHRVQPADRPDRLGG